jgi:hypothetical protein
MIVTYWKADCLDDQDRYSLRARTKRECLEMIRNYATQWQGDIAPGSERFAPPIKIVETYIDAFDLVSRALGEDGIEYRSR